jgi:hypothetical protein
MKTPPREDQVKAIALLEIERTLQPAEWAIRPQVQAQVRTACGVHFEAVKYGRRLGAAARLQAHLEVDLAGENHSGPDELAAVRA